MLSTRILPFLFVSLAFPFFSVAQNTVTGCWEVKTYFSENDTVEFPDGMMQYSFFKDQNDKNVFRLRIVGEETKTLNGLYVLTDTHLIFYAGSSNQYTSRDGVRFSGENTVFVDTMLDGLPGTFTLSRIQCSQ